MSKLMSDGDHSDWTWLPLTIVQVGYNGCVQASLSDLQLHPALTDPTPVSSSRLSNPRQPQYTIGKVTIRQKQSKTEICLIFLRPKVKESVDVGNASTKSIAWVILVKNIYSFN